MKNKKGTGENPSEKHTPQPEGKIKDIMDKELSVYKKSKKFGGVIILPEDYPHNSILEKKYVFEDEYRKKREYELTKPKYNIRDIENDTIYRRDQNSPNWEISSVHTPAQEEVDESKWFPVHGIFVTEPEGLSPEGIINQPPKFKVGTASSNDYTAYYTGKEGKFIAEDGLTLLPDRLLAVWDNSRNKLLTNNLFESSSAPEEGAQHISKSISNITFQNLTKSTANPMDGEVRIFGPNDRRRFSTAQGRWVNDDREDKERQAREEAKDEPHNADHQQDRHAVAEHHQTTWQNNIQAGETAV